MTIGQHIREFRTAKKFTQKDLADQIGARERYISDWERDVNIPRVTFVIRIADALDCSMDELCGRAPKAVA